MHRSLDQDVSTRYVENLALDYDLATEEGEVPAAVPPSALDGSSCSSTIRGGHFRVFLGEDGAANACWVKRISKKKNLRGQSVGIPQKWVDALADTFLNVEDGLEEVRCFTEHCRSGDTFRADPNYRGSDEEWRDFVWIEWEGVRELCLSKICLFVDQGVIGSVSPFLFHPK